MKVEIHGIIQNIRGPWAGIFVTSAHGNHHALRAKGIAYIQVALQLSNFSFSGNDSSELPNSKYYIKTSYTL
jgi:hypothetical protein